ncbi:cation diffusion facilitator family transporter [Mesorhizobium sp. VNQ89]|uniref:cation diffusion facilitator family transporter n=1 Tax=Mesorhizobium quangtriensis TaxID=3157709 RepID=UPI0032B7FCA5
MSTSSATASRADVKQKVARLAAWSIVIAFVVLGLKLFAWWITGSVALYSDALESIVNVVTAIAAVWAIRISYMPADRDHQHGHHKAEYFAAVFEGAMIIVAALLIMSQVIQTLSNPSPIEQPWEGLAINGGAAVLNAIWATVLIRQGRAARSPALEADGHHLMTDVMTSGGVIAGLILAVATGWTVLDPLLATLVAINILVQGWKIMGDSLSGLMDKAVGVEEHVRIRDIVSVQSKGAIEVHDLKTRIAGRATFIEFHLIVDGDMTVRESHVICDRIEEALKAEIPSVRVTIHVEPDDEAKLPPGTSAVPFA